ncbi:MAG: hypothetical protein IJ489_09480 [Clostridia bacterium]|nr:hypothetical protein [Clostridia bacterium]
MFRKWQEEMKKRNEQTAITRVEYVETLYMRYSGELRNRENELSLTKQHAEKLRSATDAENMNYSEEISLSYLTQRIEDDNRVIQELLYPLCVYLSRLCTGIRYLEKIGRYDWVNFIVSDRFVNEVSQNGANLNKLRVIMRKKCVLINEARKSVNPKK